MLSGVEPLTHCLPDLLVYHLWGMLPGLTQMLRGNHMPSGQRSTVGCNIFDCILSTQPDLPYRRPGLHPSVRTRHYHHQFGKGCNRTFGKSIRELFRPSTLHLERKVESFFSFISIISNRYSRCGVNVISLLLPYGDQWRLHRRFFNETFRPEAVHRFLPYQNRRACLLLQRLFDAPEQLGDHVFE